MCSLKKVPAPSSIAGVTLLIFLLALFGSPPVTAQQPASTEQFLPLTPGTWWLYRGTVAWSDQQTEKDAQANVTLKMTVQRVIQKPELTIAILSGFPRDLDWATGEVGAMPWLLIETKRHEIFYNSLPPDFDYAKLEKDAASLDKFLSEDNLFFRWPLKKGMKFGDAESLSRDDAHYCWVVATQETKKLNDIKGLPPRSAEVFLLQYITNPDDTELELSPGIGILSYQYHHHGTVADTSLSLVEFHLAPKTPPTPGANP
jgi:ABC-type transport system substrate-binding protein